MFRLELPNNSKYGKVADNVSHLEILFEIERLRHILYELTEENARQSEILAASQQLDTFIVQFHKTTVEH